MKNLTIPQHILREVFNADMYEMNRNGYGPFFDKDIVLSKKAIRDFIKNEAHFYVRSLNFMTNKEKSDYYNLMIAYYIRTNQELSIDITPFFRKKEYSLETRLGLAISQLKNHSHVIAKVSDKFYPIAELIL